MFRHGGYDRQAPRCVAPPRRSSGFPGRHRERQQSLDEMLPESQPSWTHLATEQVPKLWLFLVLGLLLLPVSSSSRIQVREMQEVKDELLCPVSFDYVQKFPLNVKTCKQGDRTCCAGLLYHFAIGLAEYTRQEGGFEFPDKATALSCLDSYQRSTGVNFVAACFPEPFQSTDMFIQSPSCANISNVSDWDRVVGKQAMDTSCQGDLSSNSDCRVCNDDMEKTLALLNSRSTNLPGNLQDNQCLYITCLYAAGRVNKLGPQNPGTAQCILARGGAGGPLVEKRSKNKIGLYVGVGVAVPIVAALLILPAVMYMFKARRASKESLLSSKERQQTLPNLGMIRFTYDELKVATEKFSEKNFIGEGAFGRVYRGVLSSSYGNMEVAVKVMKDLSPESCSNFMNEVEVINSIRHRNLVQVRGGCIFMDAAGHQSRILVYDYIPNGCLEGYLRGTKPVLSWPERRKIAIGTATGINYLHNEVEPAIIHRDIKPSNILLDYKFNALVADFGLAKVTPEGTTQLLMSTVAGTPVYMAVEYALYGQCSEKVDVYSFGIVLLELMSGRKALDTTEENPMHFHIVDWAWSLVKAGQIRAVIDVKIRDSGPIRVMERFVLVGILCAHLMVAFRPSMAQALRMLEGDEDIPEIPDRPAPYILS